MALSLFLSALIILAWTGEGWSTLQFQTIATGLSTPVSITHAGDGSGRLFLVLQDGRILIHDGGQVLPTPFLDLRSKVSSCAGGCGERGLLGLAFHPDYAANGTFFVHYTNRAGTSLVARYQVSADPSLANPRSGRTLLSVRQPFANHNGGQLQFGPDGYLYIGLGDGGSGGDPGNRAQNRRMLLGKILRINVNGAARYAIPPDNPFAAVRGARREIWALGLRNPWRFSFDRLTGDLYVADVGQNALEEVNFQPAGSPGGQNYGWRLMEGNQCFNPAAGCNDGSLTPPVLEYDHGTGCSVTGGYVYRGSAIPALAGQYLYGDFCSGLIWGAQFSPVAGWSTTVLHDSAFLISTFGEDQEGELYVADYGAGNIFRITGFLP
ncbi:MAG: sorbosone dehydrogenase family protein [Syntrophobacteraceae bacterium]